MVVDACGDQLDEVNAIEMAESARLLAEGRDRSAEYRAYFDQCVAGSATDRCVMLGCHRGQNAIGMSKSGGLFTNFLVNGAKSWSSARRGASPRALTCWQAIGNASAAMGVAAMTRRRTCFPSRDRRTCHSRSGCLARSAPTAPPVRPGWLFPDFVLGQEENLGRECIQRHGRIAQFLRLVRCDFLRPLLPTLRASVRHTSDTPTQVEAMVIAGNIMDNLPGTGTAKAGNGLRQQEARPC